MQDKAIALCPSADFPALNSVMPTQLPEVAGKSILEREMVIRFLFSCLVDADGLGYGTSFFA